MWWWGGGSGGQPSRRLEPGGRACGRRLVEAPEGGWWGPGVAHLLVRQEELVGWPMTASLQ